MTGLKYKKSIYSELTWKDVQRRIAGVGVGTQGGLINLSAPDKRSRVGSTPTAPTI